VTPSRRTGHWRAAIFLILSGSPVIAQQPDKGMSFKADSVSLDLQQGRSIYQRLTVSDGHMSINAAEDFMSMVNYAFDLRIDPYRRQVPKTPS
jgi:hypothetical protein